MDSPILLLIAADAILLLHVFFVVFVIVGMLVIVAGKIRGWSWVRNPWFRLMHVVAIAIVVVQSWLGIICPLTTIEMTLRTKAGDAVYSGTFVSHWLERLLYYQLPPWVFIACYMIFGVIVVVCWFWVRPRKF